MNKRGLPVFLVASCPCRLGGGPDVRLPFASANTDRRSEDRCSGNGRARAARCLLRDGQQHDPK